MRDRSPFGAPLRLLRPGLRFLESPDANGRTLSGTSAASTSQSGHAPDGLMPETACKLKATNSAYRHRTRSVSRRHRLTSLTMSGMAVVIQNALTMSKAFRIVQRKRRVRHRVLRRVARGSPFHPEDSQKPKRNHRRISDSLHDSHLNVIAGQKRGIRLQTHRPAYRLMRPALLPLPV